MEILCVIYAPSLIFVFIFHILVALDIEKQAVRRKNFKRPKINFGNFFGCKATNNNPKIMVPNGRFSSYFRESIIQIRSKLPAQDRKNTYDKST